MAALTKKRGVTPMLSSTLGKRFRPIVGAVCCLAFALVASPPVPASEPEEPAHEKKSYVGSQRNWFFISMLPGESDAETLGLELESYIGIKNYSIKNISYVEVADYPRPIPNQPVGNEFPGVEIKAGISDLLTGFWVSKNKEHHGNHHLAWGAAFQFPTATTETLGSGKWSLGPSVDYEYGRGKFFGGFIALNLWSVAGDSDRKDVNFLMIKPFIYYELAEKWDFVYVPYGISVYWKKPSGEDIYFPVGGGVQRSFGDKMNFSMQFFQNVLRPTKGTKYDLRFMLEFVFE